MFFTKTPRALLSRPGLDVKFVNSMGIRSHICGPNDDEVSDPYITVLHSCVWIQVIKCLVLFLVLKGLVFNLKTSVIISGTIISGAMFSLEHFNC